MPSHNLFFLPAAVTNKKPSNLYPWRCRVCVCGSDHQVLQPAAHPNARAWASPAASGGTKQLRRGRFTAAGRQSCICQLPGLAASADGGAHRQERRQPAQPARACWKQLLQPCIPFCKCPACLRCRCSFCRLPSSLVTPRCAVFRLAAAHGGWCRCRYHRAHSHVPCRHH